MYLVYLQYSSQCFCGTQLTKARRMRKDDCLSPCAGDQRQACGGVWRVAFYRSPRYIYTVYIYQVSMNLKLMKFDGSLLRI